MTGDLEQLSDVEILRLSHESPRAFEVLVDRYQDAFIRKSMKVVRQRETAEDIVQDTFLKIYKYSGKYQEVSGATFKSWAYKILLNTTYTYYMKLKKDRNFTEMVDFAEVDFADAEREEVEDQRPLVNKMLQRLPPDLARIFTLYFLEEKSQKEVAREVNIKPGALRTKIHRAKKYFKDISLDTL